MSLVTFSLDTARVFISINESLFADFGSILGAFVLSYVDMKGGVCRHIRGSVSPKGLTVETQSGNLRK